MPKRVSLKGKGADLFFGDYPPGADAALQSVSPAPPDEQPWETAALPAAALPEATSPDETPEPQPTSPPRANTSRRQGPAHKQASKIDSKHASTLASVNASTVETIRQVIKVPGREVSYVRVTPEEKADLTDIVYTYKRQGQKTSENEINRIALNYLLLDYREHGEQSVLARVLAALLA